MGARSRSPARTAADRNAPRRRVSGPGRSWITRKPCSPAMHHRVLPNLIAPGRMFSLEGVLPPLHRFLRKATMESEMMEPAGPAKNLRCPNLREGPGRNPARSRGQRQGRVTAGTVPTCRGSSSVRAPRRGRRPASPSGYRGKGGPGRGDLPAFPALVAPDLHHDRQVPPLRS